MIYRLYYLDKDTEQKKVRSVDDIHENNVWAVSKVWGAPVAVVLESDLQPADAEDYEEAI
jgi:hypothetical protein